MADCIVSLSLFAAAAAAAAMANAPRTRRSWTGESFSFFWLVVDELDEPDPLQLLPPTSVDWVEDVVIEQLEQPLQPTLGELMFEQLEHDVDVLEPADVFEYVRLYCT